MNPPFYLGIINVRRSKYFFEIRARYKKSRRAKGEMQVKSIWRAHTPLPKGRPLMQDINAEAVVIGGGMAGILTAKLLRDKGVAAIVVESGRAGGGVTGNTTAKITSQHGLIYDKLIKMAGEEQALQYARANQRAVEQYRKIIVNENIDCDFEERSAYVYSLTSPLALGKEYRAAKQLGIPARMNEHPGLPFPVKGAVEFPYQAQFQPLKFLQAVAQDVPIYDHTRAYAIEDGAVVTQGGRIHAKYIVIATHYPFLNAPGYYFLRMYQQRSYVLALSGAPAVNAMYIGEKDNSLSLRQWGDFLLLGGGGHRSGQPEKGGYEPLRQRARRLFPKSREVFSWSAQDCMTLDGIPYIGQFSSATPHVYVATGFGKWGMSSSMAAAMILSDQITGKENEDAPVFSPQRMHLAASVKNLLSGAGHTASGQLRRFFYVPSAQAEQLQKGEGAIVNYKGKKAGVYRDEEGNFFAVSVTCPHLGCQLEWNPQEKSWDCPCHGSRFDYKGRLLDSPAKYSCNKIKK